MTKARERRRPAGASPIALTAKVEQIQTPAAFQPVTGEPAPTVAAGADPVPPQGVPAPAGESQPPRTGGDGDPKLSRTFQLRKSVLGEAQTAVLRTAPFPGGYISLNALVAGALERELERLAGEFNDGVRFPPHEGVFRTGRPIGS